MANEMLARAADRGDMNQSPSSIASRMYRFYLSQGLPPDAALEQVSRLMSSGMYSDVAERRTGIQDRAMELARRAEEQARMRSNPRMLGEGIAAPAPADLPGYDPTARRMTGAVQAPRFSQPMTRADADELRTLRPMVQDTRPSWLRDPAQRRIPMSKAALEASPYGFADDLPLSSDRVQTYAPAAQGQPILNAGQEPPRAAGATAPAGLIGAAAAAPASAAAPAPASAAAPAPAPASAAAPAPASAANGPMSAAFLDGPSAFRQAAPSMAAPEFMRLPISYGQPERRAVQVARDVVGASPAPSPSPQPAEVSRPAVEPASRALWEILNRTDNPADFVRADKAMLAERAGRAEGGGIPEGMMGARPMPMPSLDMPAMDKPAPMGDMPPFGAMGPSGKPATGTGAGGRDAAINKALEIIHHLVIRGR